MVLGPNWFASVMGTGIVAVAGASLPIGVPSILTTAAWILASLLLIILLVAIPLHWVRTPGTFAAIADGLGIPFDILACTAPLDTLRRRLDARRDDASEATAAVLEQQREWLEPLDDAERARASAPTPVRPD